MTGEASHAHLWISPRGATGSLPASADQPHRKHWRSSRQWHPGAFPSKEFVSSNVQITWAGRPKEIEVAADGLKDDNVFDIQQGVAICLIVKRPSTEARA